MSAKQAKLLRKQLRNVSQENLNDAQVAAIVAKCEEMIIERMGKLSEEVRGVMAEMNQRNKDVQGYLVRQATAAVIPAPQKAKEGTSNETESA